MCGRYSLYDFADAQTRYGITGKAIMAEENFNVAPGQYMPVIIIENGHKKIISMKWGLIPSWAKDIKIGYKLINARDDTLFEKPMWKGLARTQRALIPARAFYEWKTDESGEKQPYIIHLKKEKVFSFAGLYSIWNDAEGHPLFSFTIITTSANKTMEPIHNRMPVILHRGDEDKWLDPEIKNDDIISAFLKPIENDAIEIYPVSKQVNSPKNNDPSLLDKI
jgi:putative SOS response-associated peptidase YedK